jgi:tRNA dimethylallyltransferase
MSRLPGVRLDTVWDQLCSADRDRLAGQPGETIAALHQLPSPVIRDWWPADWPAFTAGQRARCVSEQRTLSVPALWAHQIPRFLEGVAVPAAGAAAHRGHARAPAGRRRRGRGWRLSGLIDFEAAMRGGARVRVRPRRGCSSPTAIAGSLTRTLTAYGYHRDQLGEDLRRRLLAWGIMHRYSNHSWRLRRLPERRRAVAIYGPTPSGKTALSLDVCEAASQRGLRPVVLNADSRQVYVGMDIGTSKIKPSQMRGFEHRLLDVAEPSSKLSLEAYAQMARDELAALAASEDALPVLVGGTGVYVQSVLDGWDLTGTGTLRCSLERDFPRSDVTGAYQVLARLAPEVARRVHPDNYEAILNALVRRMAGQAGSEAVAPFAFAVYGLDRGDAETDRRIETTLDAQIRDGLLTEVAELDRRYRLVEQARRPGRRRNVASQTHGYREFVRAAASTGKAIAELDGADLAAARAEALGHIRAYSRRQRSWFGKLGASRVDHRSAAKIIVSRLQ